MSCIFKPGESFAQVACHRLSSHHHPFLEQMFKNLALELSRSADVVQDADIEENSAA